MQAPLDTTDVIKREDDSYRKGVVLGLTMAEVMILLLFCLLLTLIIVLDQKDQIIRRLSGANGSIYVVSKSTLQDLSQVFGMPENQKQIDDDFQKLISDQAAIDDVHRSYQGASLQDVAKIAKQARHIVSDSGQRVSNVSDVAKGLDQIDSVISSTKGIGIFDGTIDANKKVLLAGVLCADQYSDPRQQLECEKKIVNLAGGKGLEFQSCWWDKSVTPWKTKDLYDVALTNNGFIIRDLDPGTDEYRRQKKSDLPVSNIRTGAELTEVAFLAQTDELLKWSDQHKCRFYVRVFDQTDQTAKTLYKQRLEALEDRFYKELTAKEF